MIPDRTEIHNLIASASEALSAEAGVTIRAAIRPEGVIIDIERTWAWEKSLDGHVSPLREWAARSWFPLEEIANAVSEGRNPFIPRLRQVADKMPAA